MISPGLWKTEGGKWFVKITKRLTKHQWEGIFYSKEGKSMGTSRWNDTGTYFMPGMDQYALIERRRGEEKGWPNVL